MAARSHGHRRRRSGARWRPGRAGTAVLILVVLAALVAAAIHFRPDPRPVADEPRPSASTCPEGGLRAAVAPALAETLDDAVARAGCAGVTIEPVDPASALDQWGTAAAADVWIPDATLWRDRLESAGATPEVLIASVATSPLVIASDGAAPTTWSALLEDPRLNLADPARDTVAAATLVAATRGLDADRARTALGAGGAGSRRTRGGDAVERLTAAAAGESVTVVSEHEWLGTAVADAAAPEAGTPMLDHPLLLLTVDDAAARDSAQWLVALLESDEVLDLLTTAGFRTTRGTPAGAIEGLSALPGPTADEVDAVIDLVADARPPSRLLTVVDVSRSMTTAVGGSNRIDLTVAATLDSLDLLPDAAAVGLWSFSHEVGSPSGEEREELIETRPLGDDVDGETHRALLIDEIASLPTRVGGATALHDTTLAAYRSATEDYDPDADNAVLLLTDGSNDDPFSISLDTLVAGLEALRDPSRPVRIIAVGISEDADLPTLQRIAEATGGSAHLAVAPDDVFDVVTRTLATQAD